MQDRRVQRRRERSKPLTCDDREQEVSAMIKLQDVCYVRLGTADLDGATAFATDYLGLEIAHRSKTASISSPTSAEHTRAISPVLPPIRLSHSRLSIAPIWTPRLRSSKAWSSRPLGFGGGSGTTPCAKLHQLQGSDRQQDRTRLAARLRSRRYHGERDAGITGFSHIGLCTTDAARDESVLDQGLQRPSERPIGDAALLRFDEVHHTIALFPTDRAGIQLINHQVATATT
jgi:2,3-dihydroxy-p-cumate/2,3-dihydroxybenzoate 3,4-dioxygenase